MTRKLAAARAVGSPKGSKFDGTAFLASLKMTGKYRILHPFAFPPNISPGLANASAGTPNSCLIITSRSHGFLFLQMAIFRRRDRWNEYHGETSGVWINGKSDPWSNRPENSVRVTASRNAPARLN
jgi:hypothetical protein